MKNLTKLVGFTAILCMVNPSFAAVRVGAGGAGANATGRISVSPSIGVASAAGIAAARRLPTMKYVGVTTTTTSTSSSSDSSLMTEVECVDAYSECIRAPEACGPDFEECTTNELFYAKKPQCNSVLLQCTSAGINTLFGTTNATYVSIDNMDTYPTAGSIVGQFISAGEINNRLDTSSCVKRYMSCLKKDNVCGETFELCTSNNEFKKQKIYCESTLARCQDEGKTELFGHTDTSQNPTSESRLWVAITEGAELASQNAVNTCYKVANQCLLSACTTNPYRCIVNSNLEIVTGVDNINDNNETAVASTNPNADVSAATILTTSDVSKYLRNSCAETIGGNKYCYMTVYGKPQTAKDMADEDVRDTVYSDIYSSVMNSVLRERIKKLAEAFDTKAKDKCWDVIKSCAMRSCGGGLGSACFQKVFGDGKNCLDGAGFSTATDGCTINGTSTYNEIKTSCEAIVNTDANCQYAAASVDTNLDTDLKYVYNYSVDTAFGKLFPRKSDNGGDPIGAVSRLNKLLAETYSPAAIEALGKECRLTATSCIRSMCGTDFTKCYRNRTDVMTDTYATDEDKFNQSMNKVGGVLDFTIVRGLCVAMVKGSDACDEHLKIQQVRNYKGIDDKGKTGWGEKGSVRDAWIDAVSDGYKAKAVEVDKYQDGCTVSSGRSGGRTSGTSGTGGSMSGASGASCDMTDVQPCGTVDEKGCLYNTPHYVSIYEYQLNMEVDTLFQEVLADLELEAQAKYNSKLTEEQGMCLAANEGGIMGKKDMSSTYQWVKLKNRKVPKYYPTSGLKTSDFVASNELYGSFCRARVTIQSDDPDIQSILQKGPNWSTAYFAVGDVFTCGSWIPQADLEKIAQTVAEKKIYGVDTEKGKAELAEKQKRNRALITAATAITGGLGTAYLTDVFQEKNFLGGLWTPNRNTSQQNDRNKIAAYSCKSKYSDYTIPATKNNLDDGDKKKAYMAAMEMRTRALSIADKSGTIETAMDDVKKNCEVADGSYENAVSAACQSAVASLNSICEQTYKNEGQYANYDNNTKRQIINTVAGLGGAALTGITAYKLTESIQQSNMTAEERAAYDEFMREIGSHIYCFIGADEAGTYGSLQEIAYE